MIGKTDSVPLKWLLVFFIAHGLSGCLLQPDVDPKLLHDAPNTFAPGSFFHQGKVYRIEVYESHDRGSRVVWRVESKDGVPAKGLVVTVGRVPVGFVQIVPPGDRIVLLKKGKEYRIQIWGDEWPAGVDPSGTAWVAE